jgi:hypothetical protein
MSVSFCSPGQLGQTDTEPGSGALLVRSRRAAGATLY